MIDLHVHSTFSDGSLTPEQLVEKAEDINLTAMALTDHDNTGGITRFMRACDNARVMGIPGVEISADIDKGTMHILGYFIDTDSSDLQDVLQRIRDGRQSRNNKIIKKLNDCGFDLTMDEVAAFAGEDVVGRPHFAQALVAKGFIKSKRSVFDLYLAKGKQAYVDRFRLSPMDSIGIILKAGGVPVLSHPFTLGLDSGSLSCLVGELVDMGLKGIEVFYSEHSQRMVDEYLSLIDRFKLIATGGSDFHGCINPKINLGFGFGSLKVPDSVVSELTRVLNEERK